MRLLRLDLLRYGAFEGRSLAFDPAARLHVVHGRNEAGKSSTLSALGDLLFGFAHKSDYDFRFKAADLRIGGELVSRRGERLSFIRRKGRERTLLDPQERPLPDDALAPFLGGLTREVFAQAFGLDAEALRKGADDILKAEGEAGSSLMAAASGLRGLTQLRELFETEAGRIFSPHKGKDRRFYEARDRFDAAKKQASDLELRVGDLKKLRAAVAQAQEARDALREKSVANDREQARLSRLRRLAPIFQRLDRVERELDACRDLPDTPPGFPDALARALDHAAQAEERDAAARLARGEAAEALAGLSVDDGLLARAGEIDALVQRIGKYDKDGADLPRVRADHDSALMEIAQHAAQLGFSAADALREAQPRADQVALVEALLREGREIGLRRAALAKALDEARRDLEDMQAAARGAPMDPAPLRERLAALGSVETLVLQRDEAADRLRRDEEQLDAEARRLHPPAPDLAVLDATPLPSPAMLDDMARRMDEAQQAFRDAGTRAADAAEASRQIREALDVHASGGPLPTPERIAAARADRDALWTGLRAALFAEPDAPQGAALASGVARFERDLAEADALSDAASRESGRVAAFAAERRRLDMAEARRLAAEETLAQARAALAALESDWSALWSPCGVTPLAPRDMKDWREKLTALSARRAQLDELRAACARADRAVAALAEPLHALERDMGLPRMPGLDAGRLARRLAERLRAIEAEWSAARQDAVRREDAAKRLDRMAAERDATETDWARWTADWAGALPALGLAPDARTEQAEAALRVWALAPQAERNRAQLARRIDGIRRDRAQFEDEVAALLSGVAPDLAALPCVDALDRVSARLAAARAASAQRDLVRSRVAEEERKADRIAADLASAREALAHLVEKLPPGADPQVLQAALTRRDALRAEADRERRAAEEQSEGVNLADIRAELSACDLFQAAATLDDLAAEQSRLTAESDEALAALTEAQRQLRDREGGVGAETAVQLMRNAEAAMQQAAQDWIIRKLASSMLGQALERHRAERQDPILASASSIFSKLTGGGFAAILQTFDEKDEPVLRAQRGDGETVPVSGLSEGTRDQLYLALRLAYVDDHASRAEPAPFIGDDLFSSFDDARTVHGLHALAACGERTQCILFTHHRHVVDLAKAELGAAVDVVEM